MKLKKVIATILIGTTSFGFVGCNDSMKEVKPVVSVEEQEREAKKTEEEIKTSLETLNKAKEIIVTKDLVSLNKSYEIAADGNTFGEVNGEFIKITGDKLSFKDNNGNEISSEKQIKRWGVKLNRLAEVYNHKEEVVGYIGEEKLNDLFKLGYNFHFYDKDKNKIGSSKQKVFSFLDTFKIYDKNGKLCYEIKANLTLISDKYTITVHDSSIIPTEQAVYLTIILNGINNSKKKSSSKSGNKAK